MASNAKFLMVRADDEDKEKAKALAGIYGVSVSDLMRFALRYVDKERPDMTLTYVIRPGKSLAPSGENAALMN